MGQLMVDLELEDIFRIDLIPSQIRQKEEVQNHLQIQPEDL